jgi:small-conductance mechanosensitive channel
MLTRIWNEFTDLINTQLFMVGEVAVTPVGLVRVILIIVIAWWVSKLIQMGLSRFTSRWHGMSRASIYTLGRVIHYLVITIGLIVGLSTIGLDFTNFALLLGALGVGIGFGLQSMVSNFVSGLIILFEKSLKVGDFVVGEVREIRIRSTRITTNDNIDILVPNSEFVNGRVVNWTLDEAYRRIHVPFGVAYGTDKEKVVEAVLDAAQKVPYTLKGISGREPQVWFVRFGESSLDFELVIWLTPEAVKRPSAVQAAYLWQIHTALYQHKIEIPFPQRDLHFRSFLGLKDHEAREWLKAREQDQSSQNS